MYWTCTIGIFVIIILMIIGIIKSMDQIPTKKEDKFNKKKLIVITLLLVGIILLTFLWYSINFHYESNIERLYSSDAEKEAIQKAEELDLSAIFNISRYYDWNKQTNNPSTEPTAYVWPNMVDKEILDFYRNKIKKLEEDHVAVRASFEYNAEGKKYSEISIFYDNTSQKIVINENTYVIDISEDPSYDFFYNCAIYINSSFEIISSDIQSVQMNLSNSYIVTQDFDYWEQYDLLAGFGGGAEQIIVFDQNYLPKLILSKGKGQGIS